MRRLALICGVSLLSNICLAGGIPFEKLETEVAMELIHDVDRDAYGYIWAATGGLGLVRHNSYKAVQYLHNHQDSSSISDNTVLDIHFDTRGTMWVATKKGLNRFDREHDSFTRYYSIPINPHTLSSNIVSEIFEDYDSTLWLVTARGIDRYDYSSNTFTRYGDLPPHDPSFEYTSMAQDAEGRYWVVGTRNGIYRFTPGQNRFEHFPDATTPHVPVNIKHLYIDSRQTIWIGSRSLGLYTFDPANRAFAHYSTSGDGTGTNGTIVYDMLEDDQYLLVAVDQGGVNRYCYASKSFDYITSAGGNSGQLSSDGIYSLYKDQEGILWMGTSRGGLNYYNPKKNRFNYYRHNPNAPPASSLVFDIIGCVFEDSKGRLWIGTDGGGVSILDTDPTRFQHLVHSGGQHNSISSNVIRSIDEDASGNIWISTFDRGVNKYDPRNGTIEHYAYNRRGDASSDLIESLLIDSKNRFWLSMPHGGVSLLNNQFEEVQQFFPNVSRHEVHRTIVQEMDDGTIFVINNEGAYKYHEADSSFLHVFPVKEATILCQDRQGNYYVGSYDHGITQFNADFQRQYQYSTENGLPSNTISYLTMAENGMLWASTMYGLCSIDPVRYGVTSYYESDGLPGNQFFFQSGCKTAAGNLCFGGIHGLLVFNPDSIRHNMVPAPVYIEELYLFNKRIRPNEKGSVLTQTIATTHELHLGWKQNMIGLQFTAINFTYPYKNTYSYKLEGFDTDWTVTHSGNRRASYTNLDPGDYTLRVRAVNNDLVPSENEATLRIIIAPPFWKRVWFYMLNGALLIVSIVVFIKVREQRLKNDKILLQKRVEERTRVISQQHKELNIKNQELSGHKDRLEMQTEELQAQKEMLQQNRDELEQKVQERTIDLKDALEQAQKSDMLKTRFLANMSHEIRTPMNAIVGFSELLDDQDYSDTDKKHFVEVIKHNSDVLLRLIQDILDISLIEADQLSVQKLDFSLNEFFTKLHAQYVPVAQNKKVEIRFVNTLHQGNYTLCTDEGRLRQILTNLINNALKFTKKGFVEVRIEILQEQFLVHVKDSGRGMTTEEQKIVFQQFVKLDDDTTEQNIRGVGLGLSIAKRLSELLEGELKVESSFGKGSIFTLSLPHDVLEQKSFSIEASKIDDRMPDWSSKTILIVEDEIHNYDFLAAALRTTKARIVWGQNGLEATRLYLQDPAIDMVLLDIKMPHMDGYETIAWLREQNPSLIVIAQTAYAHTEDKKKIEKAGFNAWITKPINKKELFNVMGTFLK